MDKKFILFDLDGTLTDPFVGITRSVQYSLASYGIHVENPGDLAVFIGPPLRESYMKYYGFGSEEAEKAVTKYREYYSEQGIFENKLYDGMDMLLRTLFHSGKTLIVATSKPTVFAEKILCHFEIDKYFSYVSGCELDGRRSKKSEVIQYALDNMRITSLDKAIMIGDREHDVLGANENGIESIGVLYGYGSLQELTAANATYIAASISELSELLNATR